MIDSKRFFQIDKKKKERRSFPMLRTKHFQCLTTKTSSHWIENKEIKFIHAITVYNENKFKC